MYGWREPLTDDEMVKLIDSHGRRSVRGWWDQVRPNSLGWVTARTRDGALVGFVNVAWDGVDHAFLLDTKTHGAWQRRGIGTEVVRRAATHAKAAGCEWLHVDFEGDLAPLLLRRLRLPTHRGRADPPPFDLVNCALLTSTPHGRVRRSAPRTLVATMGRMPCVCVQT